MSCRTRTSESKKQRSGMLMKGRGGFGKEGEVRMQDVMHSIDPHPVLVMSSQVIVYFFIEEIKSM